jgi:D-3-phosphoglycerate dehydrogenase
MRTIFHDLREIPESEREGAAPVSLETLLAQSDVLSVHVDGREGNRDLIGEQSFGRMKRDVVFVNMSRGFVVDERACAAFLRSNEGARAILDVHRHEPVRGDSGLLGLENAVLLPHLGSATTPAKRAMSWVVRDVVRVLRGEAPAFEARVS